VTFHEQNAGRIVGGVNAVAHSWPATAYILFNYKFNLKPYGIDKIEEVIYSCEGTLISRDLILTAAHCLPDQVTITYQGHDYIVDVEPNEFFPTNESMYKVYLGFQNISHIHSASTHDTGIEVDVDDLIKVTYFFIQNSLTQLTEFYNFEKN